MINLENILYKFLECKTYSNEKEFWDNIRWVVEIFLQKYVKLYEPPVEIFEKSLKILEKFWKNVQGNSNFGNFQYIKRI